MGKRLFSKRASFFAWNPGSGRHKITDMKKTLFNNGFLFKPDGTFQRGALLVKGDRIGSVMFEGTPPAGPAEPGCDTIDLGGRYLIPGFVDAHIHLMSLALKTHRCDLGPAGSLDEALEIMRKWSAGQDTQVLMGVDWDESRWTDRTRPSRDMLDGLIPNRPVFLRRICGHVAVVNTAFQKILEKHGIPVHPATGVIEEEAVWSANRLSNPEPERIIKSFRGAIAHLHTLGITGIHDIIEPTQFDNYIEGILTSGRPLRIKGLLSVDPGKIGSFQERARGLDMYFQEKYAGSGSSYFEIIGSKVFLDGSLGGWTAALNEPYADSKRQGEMLIDDNKIKNILAVAYEAGCVCAVHAIGDRTVRTALQHLAEFPADSRNFRMEHAEVTGPVEMELLDKAPVDLVVQPNFVRNWGGPGGLNETRLGPQRWRHCNRFRSFKQAGIRFAFSSDGMPAGPLYGLKGAIDHFNPQERIPPGEALLRYTRTTHEICASAPAGGLLEAGLPADLAVLSADPLTADPDSITVLKTFVGGQKVHDTDLTKPL
jgi:predicted amidohydrolase YtcJ